AVAVSPVAAGALTGRGLADETPAGGGAVETIHPRLHALERVSVQLTTGRTHRLAVRGFGGFNRLLVGCRPVGGAVGSLAPPLLAELPPGVFLPDRDRAHRPGDLELVVAGLLGSNLAWARRRLDRCLRRDLGGRWT